MSFDFRSGDLLTFCAIAANTRLMSGRYPMRYSQMWDIAAHLITSMIRIYIRGAVMSAGDKSAQGGAH